MIRDTEMERRWLFSKEDNIPAREFFSEGLKRGFEDMLEDQPDSAYDIEILNGDRHTRLDDNVLIRSSIDEIPERIRLEKLIDTYSLSVNPADIRRMYSDACKFFVVVGLNEKEGLFEIDIHGGNSVLIGESRADVPHWILLRNIPTRLLKAISNFYSSLPYLLYNLLASSPIPRAFLYMTYASCFPGRDLDTGLIPGMMGAAAWNEKVT